LVSPSDGTFREFKESRLQGNSSASCQCLLLIWEGSGSDCDEFAFHDQGYSSNIDNPCILDYLLMTLRAYLVDRTCHCRQPPLPLMTRLSMMTQRMTAAMIKMSPRCLLFVCAHYNSLNLSEFEYFLFES